PASAREVVCCGKKVQLSDLLIQGHPAQQGVDGVEHCLPMHAVVSEALSCVPRVIIASDGIAGATRPFGIGKQGVDPLDDWKADRFARDKEYAASSGDCTHSR